MQVPRHSAWIPQELDMAAYVDSSGELAMTPLKEALTACVDAGDRLHDQTEWG